MKCKRCKKKVEELYYNVKYSGGFVLSVDGVGNEEVDFGGYNLADDFIENMLVEIGERKLIGCNNCVGDRKFTG
uniref:Uncharacterized protein n=1 Tax=viral metagenome TaxID=1070528 RepID=A0A6M3JG21_9ZZZZ